MRQVLSSSIYIIIYFFAETKRRERKEGEEEHLLAIRIRRKETNAFTQPVHSPRPDGLFGEDSEKDANIKMYNIVELCKARKIKTKTEINKTRNKTQKSVKTRPKNDT